VLAAAGCGGRVEPSSGTAPNSTGPAVTTGATEPGEGGVPVGPPPTGTPSAPSSSPAPSGGLVPDEQLSAFVRACEESMDARGWQPGQVSYPRTMTLEVGQEETYNAAVDVRSAPAPPEEVIDAADPTSEPVLVRCVLSARLVPVGDHISVTTDDQGSVIDGWSYQTFTPSGTVEWAWTVTADAPEPGGLRLVLRPAAVASDVLTARVSSEQTYETDVEVTGSFLARASHWFDTEFPLLKALAVTLGGVLVGVLAWYGGIRAKWRELRGHPAASGPASGPSTAARAPTPPQPVPRRRKPGKGKKARNPR
jgi:hypothetical protein